MSWWVAGAMAVKAGSQFLGSQSKSKDMKEAARDSLLTGRYNINQRKLESRQTQFAMLEQGHQAASNIQRSADQAVGTATAAAGGSGAIVESGTPRAVLTNIAQEGLHAQMGAILNTKNAIKANVRQTEAMNKTEWNQANAYSKGMERDAKRTMDNARMNLAADTISAVAGGYAKGLSTVATGVKVAKDARSATGGKGDESLAKSPYDQRGYSPTIKDRLKFGGYTDGSRSFSWDKFKKGQWGSAFEYLGNKPTYKGKKKSSWQNIKSSHPRYPKKRITGSRY